MNDAVESRIFLSASVPLPSRHREYFDTADVIAIRDAVRALTMVVVEQHGQLVFGGHPAITPMIHLQIAQTGSPVGERVMMFQSRYFEREFHKTMLRLSVWNWSTQFQTTGKRACCVCAKQCW
jgi:hypothetical protein